GSQEGRRVHEERPRLQPAVPRDQEVRRRAGDRRQHHRAAVRHEVAPGPQRRPRPRLHDLLAHRRRREVRAQEQDPLQGLRLPGDVGRAGRPGGRDVGRL
ncbi:MAG: LSU ribosomal protein L27p, partial [uncultured Gemmatimonadaceae bacterium]